MEFKWNLKIFLAFAELEHSSQNSIVAFSVVLVHLHVILWLIGLSMKSICTIILSRCDDADTKLTDFTVSVA